MLVYLYDKNGYYKGTHRCQKGIKNETLYPGGNFTKIKPTFEDGKIPKFKNEVWENVIDNRNKIFYNKETKQKIIWKNIEDYEGDEYTEIVPPGQYYKWDVNNWIEDFEKYKIDKIEQMESLIIQKLLRWGKALTAIQAQFNNVFIPEVESGNSFIEIDNSFDSMIAWLTE